MQKPDKPGRTFSGFSRIFMELSGFKVELAPPHGNSINGVANPKIVYSLKAKQGIDRKSSIERSCRFGQSSGKIEAVITISVTSLYLPVLKEDQVKTQTDIT